MKQFKNAGRVEKFPELCAIADAIFTKKMHFQLPDGTRLRTKLFKGTLFAVDYNGVRYVEQNPKTSSAYALRVRDHGARIFWVIRTHKKCIDAAGSEQYVPCTEEWLGYVEDGGVYLS
jgi:hypothetical protein